MQTCFMDNDPSLSPAVAGRDIAIGVSGKSSPDGAVVGVESLPEDPSVPVAATEDEITVSTTVAGRSNGEPHRPNPWLNHDDPTAEINSSSSLSWSDPDPDSPVDAYSGDHFRMFQFKVRPCAHVWSLDWTECPYAHPGEYARRRDPRKFHYSDSACPGSGPFKTNSMGGTPVSHNVEGGNMLAGVDSASLISRGMGVTVFQTGNVEGALIRLRSMLAGIGLASPISMGDTLVIQTGDVEAGHLLTGIRFGVGRSDITPMNDDFRMYIVNSEPQTGNYPPPLEISGDNSHLVRPLGQHLRSNCFVILFVTSEILGMVFEIIYQESHIMAYFFIWIVCATIAMYVARLLAMIEGGMANREQFAVYLRCFSFLLLELLQCWGIHQGNYVIALKIILKVTGAVIGWWVVGVLQSYMDAFGMRLPLRRRDD